jgi:Prolyl oligopeptidase family
MTSWTIAHTDRFKAACSEGAINNIQTQFGTSDIGHIWNVGESGFLPWENLAWYVEHSPLTHVENVRTPLLIIHAKNDLRCPIDQAEQMFVAQEAWPGGTIRPLSRRESHLLGLGHAAPSSGAPAPDSRLVREIPRAGQGLVGWTVR